VKSTLTGWQRSYDVAKSSKKGKKGGKDRGKPPYNIQVSRKVGEEYKRVSLTGLWKAGKDAPDGVVLGGSLSGEYLEKAAEFLTRAAKKDAVVYLNVWENDGKGGKKKDKDEDEESDERDDEKDADEEDEDDEDDEDDESPF
jgi:hypothetical protein